MHTHPIEFSVGLGFVLGMLHAIEPGHGKTAMFVYMLRQRNAFWHPVIMGLTTAVSHAFSLAIIASVVHLGAHWLAGDTHAGEETVSTCLQWISSLLLIGIGLRLFVLAQSQTVTPRTCRCCGDMSGVYRDGQRWGTVLPGLLEAQMQGVDAVVHPRSSNTWGPLSLDHVYEFMGGITLAVRETTGQDPTGYFSDQRQPGRAKVTTSVGAIREEARTSLWNPKYIQSMQREGPSAAASMTETVRNMYGWNVMQPAAISRDMWDETYRVYIEDKHQLNMRAYFEEKNPYALQDMTAVMLETARKGYWQPDAEVLQRLAELHTELVAEHGAACSYETCGNAAFHEFLQQQLNAPGYEANPQTMTEYQLALSSALKPSQAPPDVQGIEMNEVKEELAETQQPDSTTSPGLLVLVSTLVVGAVLTLGSFQSTRR